MSDATKIRALNDDARRTLIGCRVMLTSGVQALGKLHDVLAAVRSFDEFHAGNDPYGEHDFGSIELFGEKLFWKFDYYDLDLSFASPDPSDPSVTARVLTIMLADEY
jgi:hypothetical protein